MMQGIHYIRSGPRAKSVTRFLYPAGIMLLLWITCAEVNATQLSTDYLLPGEARGGFISASSSTESGPSNSAKSSSANYLSMNGSTYQLVENRGQYVNVLTPQSFPEGSLLTADHIQEMVDRLDILYAQFSRVLGGEPAGNGLMTVAFVPQTCGTGCGFVGAKGIEILADKQNYESIARELDQGRLEPVLIHEMAHNFDIYANYLHYLPDHPHAWTDVLEIFVPFHYARSSSLGTAPDDLYDAAMNSVWRKYVGEQSANWKRCVRDDACAELGISANQLWAMAYYRIGALHGTRSILDSFGFLQAYARDKRPPASDEEKEGLRILSLAVGAGANIACSLDALKWPVPANTRAEMKRRFGSAQWCADQDGDGFIAINGDCDDSSASRNIFQLEIANNALDDDCDGLVDENVLIEADAGVASDNFHAVVSTNLPFEVTASIFDHNDTDSFSFPAPPSGRVRVTLCAELGFKGWVIALQPNGSFLNAANWYSYQALPACISNTFDFAEFENGTVVVKPDEAAGNYSLTVTEAARLLPDFSPLVQVEANPSGGMILRVSDEGGWFDRLGADELEVWIAGTGVQFFTPLGAGGAIDLNKNTVPELRHGAFYQLRIRPWAKGLPLADFSAGHLFRYDLLPRAVPVIDHRFSGAWFDSTHDGEGFIVEVLENHRALVYWFTYQADGRQRWMLGLGTVQDNTITITDLMDTRGGRFGAEFDPDDVVLSTVGSLTLSFLDCSTALVNYSVDNIGSHQLASRLTHVYGHGCESDTLTPDKDVSGSWYDPSHNGEGFIIEQISVDTALVFWFTYDHAGNQSWMVNTGVINDGTINIPQLLQPTGGNFGRSFDPASVTRPQWGELTLELGCSGGTASYKTQVEGFSNGFQSLVPLTRLAGTGCTD